jgi:hypothetical protein
MSSHKIPLTDLERSGLIAHGFESSIGKPSQVVDIFRQGIAWVLMSEDDRAVAVAQRREIDDLLQHRKNTNG